MDSNGNIEIKNIFEWLNHITYDKTPPEKITEESWDCFNSWLVHRFLSMYEGYIDITNVVQKFPLTEKKLIYNTYRSMIPKKKIFLKYVKNQKKNTYDNLLKYVAEYYHCSLGEAEEYIDIIREAGVRGILWEMGIGEKEADKLIKQAKI